MLNSSLMFSRGVPASLDLEANPSIASICGYPCAQHVDLGSLRSQFGKLDLISNQFPVPRVVGQGLECTAHASQRQHHFITPIAHMVCGARFGRLVQLMAVCLGTAKEQVEHHIQLLRVLALQQLACKPGLRIQGKDLVPGGIGVHVRHAFLAIKSCHHKQRAKT